MGTRNSTHEPQETRPTAQQSNDCLRAFYIDENGQEVLITEEMIQLACEELDKRLVKPANKN